MGLIFIREETESYFLGLQAYLEKCENPCKDTLLAIEALQENEQLQTKAWKAASERLLEIHNGIIAGFYMAKDAVQESLERFRTTASGVADDDKDCVWREESIITLIQTLREDEDRILQQLEELYAIRNAGGNVLWRIATSCMERTINEKLELLEDVRRAIAKLNERLDNLYEMENMTKGLLETPQDILYALLAALQDGKVLLTGEGECTDGSWKKVISLQEVYECIKNDLYKNTEIILGDKISLTEINSIFGESNVRDVLFNAAKERGYRIDVDTDGNAYVSEVLSLLSGYTVLYDSKEGRYYVNKVRKIKFNEKDEIVVEEAERTYVDIDLLKKGYEIETKLAGISELKIRNKETVIGMGRIMLQEGYDAEFVAGMLGNIESEGSAGHLESSNYDTKKPPAYIVKLNNHGYSDYSGKDIGTIGVSQLIAYSHYIHDKCHIGTYGIGCIQWTPWDRHIGLLETYQQMNNNYPTINECIKTEATYMLYEISPDSKSFSGLMGKVNEKTDKMEGEQEAYKTAVVLCKEYIRPKEDTSVPRGEMAKKIYRAMMGEKDNES